MKVKEYDIVRVVEKKKEYFAKVKSVGRSTAVIWPSINDLTVKTKRVLLAALKPLPKVHVTAADLKSFCRYEMTYKNFSKGNIFVTFVAKEKYQIRLDDLLAALNNIINSKVSLSDAEDWYFCLDGDIYHLVGLDHYDNMEVDDDGLPTIQSVLFKAMSDLDDAFEFDDEEIIKSVRDEIAFFIENAKKPFSKREYLDYQKLEFIQSFGPYHKIADQSKKYRDLWRSFVEEMCAKENEQAIYIKAYACYGDGNGVYKQDWDASMECLLKLMKIHPDADVANTLGYMYYYGRCNHGKPQYAKAFKYFSIGAAGGVRESQYKLSDMFMHGYAVEKNEEIAIGIVEKLYQECLQEFCAGYYINEFADVALRMGRFYEESEEYQNKNAALGYYLQAEYAIRRRMDTLGMYGDQSVYEKIQSTINKIIPETYYEPAKKTINYLSISELLESQLDAGHLIQMDIKPLKNGQKKLTFSMIPNSASSDLQFLVTIPEAGYCSLMEKVEVTLTDIKKFKLVTPNLPIIFDNIDGDSLTFYGNEAAYIDGRCVYRIK